MQLEKEVDIILMIVFIALFFGFGVYIGVKDQSGEKFVEIPSVWDIAPNAKEIFPSIKNIFVDEEEKKPVEEMPAEIVEEEVKIIEIKNTRFNPSSLNVSVGTTVYWVNQDPNRNYQVYEKSSDQLFNSLQIMPYQSFNYTFEKEGVYYFNDAIFTYMNGVVRVE